MAKNLSNPPAKRSDDRMIYKAMIDIAILVAALCLLPVLRRGCSNIDSFEAWHLALKWFAIGFAALAVIAAVLTAVLRGTARKISVAGILVFAVLALCALALYLFAYEAIPFFYFFAIAAAVLYLVHLLYPVDFLLLAAVIAVCGGVFYLHSSAGYLSGKFIVLYIAAALLIAADLWLANRSVKHSGRVYFGKRSFRFYARKGGPKPTYFAGAILLACIVASLVFGSVFAYYCMFFAAALLFILACYYTFRLD